VTESDETSRQRRARLRMELASGYFEHGQTTVALDEIKQALVADPNYADAYNLRGLIYMRLEDAGMAEDSFRRAVAINPRDPNVRHNYGWLLCQQNRFGDAAQQFTEALAVPSYTDRAKTLMTQGVCELKAGQRPQAERSLMQAYEIDAGNPVVGFNLASLLAQREEWSRAQFYIRRVNNSRRPVPRRCGSASRSNDGSTTARPSRSWGANCNAASPSRGRQSAYERGNSMTERVSEFGTSAALPLEEGDITHKTAGDLLREAREAHGLHIEMVAAALKVPPQKLMALEADDIDSLPDPVFARALASSVCRALRIDPAFPCSPSCRTPARTAGGGRPHAQDQHRFRHAALERRPLQRLPSRALLTVVVLLLIGAGALFWLPQSVFDQIGARCRASRRAASPKQVRWAKRRWLHRLRGRLRRRKRSRAGRGAHLQRLGRSSRCNANATPQRRARHPPLPANQSRPRGIVPLPLRAAASNWFSWRAKSAGSP
jgi:type IV pilus assembly protein PilF